MTADGALDRTVLANLKALTHDDNSFVVELIDLFLDHSSEQMKLLLSAYEGGDCEGVGAAAHTLKGSAAGLGASHVAARASDLDSLCSSGSLDGARPLIDALTTALDDASAALRAERQTAGGGT